MAAGYDIGGCLQERQGSSRVSKSGAETDPLSALPREAIELILCYLPLDEVVRTSVLSKQWRHVWKTIPDIIFDHMCFPIVGKEHNTWDNKLNLSEAVHPVLENHTGIIQKVVISHPNLTFVHPGIDQWVIRLSRCPLKEFSLILWSSPDCRYKMHPSLLELRGWKSLELCSCSLDHFPLNFGDVFKCLRTLRLLSTPMQQERFENLVKSCPLLEILSYSHRESYFPTLKIEAPRLFQFIFDGVFDSLCVVVLDTGTSCPDILPFAFPNLTSLGVETDPTWRRELESLFCMLMSFSHLTSLFLWFRESTAPEDDVENPNSFQEDRRGCLHLPEIRVPNVSLVQLVDFISSKGQCPAEETYAGCSLLCRSRPRRNGCTESRVGERIPNAFTDTSMVRRCQYIHVTSWNRLRSRKSSQAWMHSTLSTEASRSEVTEITTRELRNTFSKTSQKSIW
ncbi:hypothetical protein MLD38_016385 [Melastoma candidum]|uniref:Uncharacterized protein n=1 Tax=Melastoma candidum TaxID=119954 RepID=A0ACB9RIU2_9MYRT|nr:hypothetical protein MLD38_016385 [Melastoma candidum]